MHAQLLEGSRSRLAMCFPCAGEAKAAAEGSVSGHGKARRQLQEWGPLLASYESQSRSFIYQFLLKTTVMTKTTTAGTISSFLSDENLQRPSRLCSLMWPCLIANGSDRQTRNKGGNEKERWWKKERGLFISDSAENMY